MLPVRNDDQLVVVGVGLNLPGKHEIPHPGITGVLPICGRNLVRAVGECPAGGDIALPDDFAGRSQAVLADIRAHQVVGRALVGLEPGGEQRRGHRQTNAQDADGNQEFGQREPPRSGYCPGQGQPTARSLFRRGMFLFHAHLRSPIHPLGRRSDDLLSRDGFIRNRSGLTS